MSEILILTFSLCFILLLTGWGGVMDILGIIIAHGVVFLIGFFLGYLFLEMK